MSYPAPTPYVRGYDFSDHEAANPAAPAAGAQHDAELDTIASRLQSCINALSDVRRSDGVLTNYLVTLDSLSPTVRVMMGGWVPRGAWVTGTVYAAKDLVRDGSADDYVCVTAHTAGVFATDAAAGKWMKVAVLTSGGYATLADVSAAQSAAIASSAASLASHVALANPHGTTAANVGALPTAGGTMVGDIVLKGDPTSALHPATKQYADALVAPYAPLAGATFAGNILAPRVSFTDANFYGQVSGTAAYVVFAANNMLVYDRTNEWFYFSTNSVIRMVVDKSGRTILGGGTAPATGYTNAGDLTLPAAGAVYAKNTAKAWVNFNGTGVIAIRSSFNVASLTDNGAGDWTVTYTNAMADANYAVVASGRFDTGGLANAPTMGLHRDANSVLTTSCRIASAVSGTGAATDADIVNVVVFGGG